MDEARAKHNDVVDLEGRKATRMRFLGILRKRSPKFVFLNGHGNERVVGGHDDEVLLDMDERAVAGKVVYARACRSAKELGPQAVNHGAAAFIGYDEDFIFVVNEAVSTRPTADDVAGMFLEPSNQTALSLLRGNTAMEANMRSKERFAANIQKLLLRGPSEDDYYAIRHLLWDLRHQVCLGDADARL